MQNHQGTIDNPDLPKISQSDKLLFCAFLAIAVHAMLLFGIGFKLPETSSSPYQKTFNVLLAQFETEQRPDKADFIGQANQEGGGDSEQALTPSAMEMAQFNDPDAVSSEPLQMASRQPVSAPATEVITGNGVTVTPEKMPQPLEETESLPDASALINKSYQLSGLIASLDERTVNQARKGRKRAVSASIHRASDALYLDGWRRKIERIGNLNYPEKAKQDKIYGNLTMKVAINKDGTINAINIMQSSGNKLLDDSALRIVRLAAPFKPLSREMSKDTDVLEIIRVWQFQPDYQLSTR